MKPTIIGIDCGKSGGVAVSGLRVDNIFQPCTAWPMPATTADIFYELGLLKLQAETEDRLLVAYVEQVPKFAGKNIPSSTSFVLGQNYGVVLGILTALKIETRLVTPQKWQKGVGIVRTKGSTATEWKNKLKAEAQRRFPNIKPRVTLKTADALLIMDYGLQNYGAG